MESVRRHTLFVHWCWNLPACSSSLRWFNVPTKRKRNSERTCKVRLLIAALVWKFDEVCYQLISKDKSSYHGKQWHNSCSHFRASASCLHPFYTPETTIITPLFKYLPKKTKWNACLPTYWFSKTLQAKLFGGQRSLDIPLENPPTKLSQLSSCKVDDGIAEVMPRLARSKM